MTIGRIPSVEGGIQPTIMDAKADLLTATAADTPARLAVGNNGETLLADSSTTTGLRWSADWNTGKNKIINGDFYWNQRAFSSTTTSGAFTFDRWSQNCVDGTVTTSAQTFTLGTAPVAGYEGRNFIRQQTTGQTLANTVGLIYQPIESVRTLANQTVTISFWAKAASGTPKVAVEINQVFGTGGSPSASVSTLFGQVTLSTSWTRYSVTGTIPSISGKTLGTNNNDSANLVLWNSAGSDFNARTGSLGIQSNTFDFWGVQVEAGSVATPFTTATGTIQGELAACQRYYVRYTATDAYGMLGVGGWTYSATNFWGNHIRLPQQFRVPPTSVDYSALQVIDTANGTYTVSAVTLSSPSLYNGSCEFTIAGGTTARIGTVRLNNNAAGYLGFSAEL